MINPKSIKAARTAANLTQAQAATMIGASTRTWQDWEQTKPDGTPKRNMPQAKWALFKIMIGGK